jgi:hypothetical protein
LPEGAVQPHEVSVLESVLDEYAVRFLIAGVRRRRKGGAFGGNYLLSVFERRQVGSDISRTSTTVLAIFGHGLTTQ